MHGPKSCMVALDISPYQDTPARNALSRKNCQTGETCVRLSRQPTSNVCLIKPRRSRARLVRFFTNAPSRRTSKNQRPNRSLGRRQPPDHLTPTPRPKAERQAPALPQPSRQSAGPIGAVQVGRPNRYRIIVISHPNMQPFLIWGGKPRFGPPLPAFRHVSLLTAGRR